MNKFHKLIKIIDLILKKEGQNINKEIDLIDKIVYKNFNIGKNEIEEIENYLKSNLKNTI